MMWFVFIASFLLTLGLFGAAMGLWNLPLQAGE